MPTTFTHDLFGKEVYQQLPDNLKEVISSYKKQFLIGLHGPDIFFYKIPFIKNSVNQFGYRLHKEEASNIFERGILLYKEHPSKALLSYLLGFACHYILDHTCHPYINKYEEVTKVSHSEIETHLDRYFMLQHGKEPLSYRPACSICINAIGNKVIHELFPQIVMKDVRKSLKGLKFYTSVTICKKDWTRAMLYTLLKLVGCYDSMKGQIMIKNTNPMCDESTQHLVKLYGLAKTNAIPLLKNLYNCCVHNDILSVEFSYNFN